MNGNDWTAHYPRIVEEAARIKGAAILDAKWSASQLERSAEWISERPP